MNPPHPAGEPRRNIPLPPRHLSSSSSSSSSSSVPLLNLAIINSRIDSIHNFLSGSISSNTILTEPQMDTLSNEISSAIHQIIINGAALLACSTQNPTPSCPKLETFCKDQTFVTKKEEEEPLDADFDIVELDAIELLAENIHFCDICGKGFKRDANLRMHMRAHGDQFKTLEALAKPSSSTSSNHGFDDNKGEGSRKTRFSCPFDGCNRNKKHRKFRPLKSVICVKNHFKRSHCPKMYSCNRCNKKSFSVLADLKSHLKHCGEAKWMCSCGTSFSRKDKLFGHVALFEGHMPMVSNSSSDNSCNNDVDVDDDERLVEVIDEEGDVVVEVVGHGADLSSDNEPFDWLLDGFGSVDYCSFQDVLNGIGSGMDGFSRC